MADTFAYRFDQDLEPQVRALASDTGASINRTLNDLVRAGLLVRMDEERSRRRLNDPAWVEKVGREIRSELGEVMDLLAQ